jgi:hypothetical protein
LLESVVLSGEIRLNRKIVGSQSGLMPLKHVRERTLQMPRENLAVE